MQERWLRLTRAGTSSVENLGGRLTRVEAPRGRLMMVLDFTVKFGKIVAIDDIADPRRLAALELAVLDG